MTMLVGEMVMLGSRTSTPLVRLSRFAASAPVWMKAEQLLISGSVFDRIADDIVRASPNPSPEATWVVAGAGSVCLAFARVLARVPAKLIVVCSSSMLPEHRVLLRQHRLKLILVPGASNPRLLSQRAAEEAKSNNGVVLYSPEAESSALAAFESNLCAALSASTGLLATPVHFVVPYVSRALVTSLARAGGRVIATVAEDEQSLQSDLVTSSDAVPVAGVELVTVSDQDAFAARRALASSEGVLVGLSSAGALGVARSLAAPAVAIAVDAGDRYFSVDRRMNAGANS